jgi:hypothetical protein
METEVESLSEELEETKQKQEHKKYINQARNVIKENAQVDDMKTQLLAPESVGRLFVLLEELYLR